MPLPTQAGIVTLCVMPAGRAWNRIRLYRLLIACFDLEGLLEA